MKYHRSSEGKIKFNLVINKEGGEYMHLSVITNMLICQIFLEHSLTDLDQLEIFRSKIKLNPETFQNTELWHVWPPTLPFVSLNSEMS